MAMACTYRVRRSEANVVYIFLSSGSVSLKLFSGYEEAESIAEGLRRVASENAAWAYPKVNPLKKAEISLFKENGGVVFRIDNRQGASTIELTLSAEDAKGLANELYVRLREFTMPGEYGRGWSPEQWREHWSGVTYE
jgi:hypothetical protein